MNKIKKLKIQLSASIFLLFCLIIFGAFFSSGFENFALALSANYSKTLPASLDLSEWNNLDDDFVAKSGSTMTGVLDMGGNRITNVATPSVASPGTDAANKEYVDLRIAAIGGSGAGGVYTNWGREDCPAGSELLYSGIGFSADSLDIGGSDNPICVDSFGTAGGVYGDANGDKMYPMATGVASNLPPGIGSNYFVKCAVCRKSGTCYESYGRWGCGGTGFSSAYNGYVLGSFTTMTNAGNSGKRLCVNSGFDAEYLKGTTGGTILVGSKIQNDYGLGYTMGSFILCSVCCN